MSWGSKNNMTFVDYLKVLFPNGLNTLTSFVVALIAWILLQYIFKAKAFLSSVSEDVRGIIKRYNQHLPKHCEDVGQIRNDVERIKLMVSRMLNLYERYGREHGHNKT
jgi:hypothetical protein